MCISILQDIVMFAFKKNFRNNSLEFFSWITKAQLKKILERAKIRCFIDTFFIFYVYSTTLISAILFTSIRNIMILNSSLRMSQIPPIYTKRYRKSQAWADHIAKYRVWASYSKLLLENHWNWTQTNDLEKDS